jgi:hypothetical protein
MDIAGVMQRLKSLGMLISFVPATLSCRNLVTRLRRFYGVQTLRAVSNLLEVELRWCGTESRHGVRRRGKVWAR